MPLLLKASSDNKLYLSFSNSILCWNLQDDHFTSVNLPQIPIPDKVTKGQEENLKELQEIILVEFSHNYQKFLISTHNKQVVIYSKDLEVQHNFLIPRTASKIRFFPQSEEDLVIADKTGDAFKYSLKEEKLDLLLGHLSMLLDVALSDCEKFIVTCDRDEKIRISHYPNCYNILSFCLAHEEFVGNVELVNDLLISASGDGTVRIWDFKSGIEVAKADTNALIDKEVILSKFTKEFDLENINIKAVPIISMQILQITKECVLILVQLLAIDQIFVYNLDLSMRNLSFVQNINIGALIFSFDVVLNKLYVLSCSSLRIYEFCEGLFQLTKENFKFHENFKEVIENHKLAENKDISALYKRKFDNVQEYLERKKIRLENKS